MAGRIVYLPLNSADPLHDLRSEPGELIINETTGEMYYRRDDGTVVSTMSFYLGGVVGDPTDPNDPNFDPNYRPPRLITYQEVDKLAVAALLHSPVFTGMPTVPTAPDDDDSLIAANTAFVQEAIRDNVETMQILTSDSPALNGTPTTPTASVGDNSTLIASTGFVASAIANLIASAPGTMDTLNELAGALGDDPNFATSMTSLINSRLADGDIVDNGTF